MQVAPHRLAPLLQAVSRHLADSLEGIGGGLVVADPGHERASLPRNQRIADTLYRTQAIVKQDGQAPGAGSHSSKRVPSGSTAHPNRPCSDSCAAPITSTPAARS